MKILQNNFSLPPGRMSVFKGIKNTVLIDSSYNNATLTPILDLLSFVKEIGKQRRRSSAEEEPSTIKILISLMRETESSTIKLRDISLLTRKK